MVQGPTDDVLGFVELKNELISITSESKHTEHWWCHSYTERIQHQVSYVATCVGCSYTDKCLEQCGIKVTCV